MNQRAGNSEHAAAARPDRAGPAAFTLIEVIVVMVLVAVMAIIAVPRMSNLSSTRSAVAARMIARDLTYARERAIATGTRTWVVFNAGTSSYSVLSENPASPGRMGASVMTDPNLSGKTYVQYLNIDQYAGVSISAIGFDSGAEVGFDWVGKPYNSASTALSAAGSVTLTGGYSVTIQPTTGLAKVLP